MGNWAIVIGVDKYAAPHLNLKGAVRDALAMAAYLLEGPSQLVDDPNHLTLLVSRTDASPPLPASLSTSPATLENIVNAITDVVRKPGERLFVHFSGHGLMAPGLTGGEAILPEEYKPALPGNSISLNGIRDFLRTARFDEQFLFIDACRNIPLEGNFNIGQFPTTPKPEDMRPSVKQYVFCATSRGVKANELRARPNEEGGVFTSALLRGLRGEGGAKIYDADADTYHVTTGRLLRFVSGEVRQAVTQLGLAGAGEFPQEPRLIGEVGDTEATVATIAPADVPRVALRFAVEPQAAAPLARVRVVGDETPTAGPPIDEQTEIDLPQRDYKVIGESDGFEPLKRSWPAVLYGDLRLTLRFKLAAPTPRGLSRGAAIAPRLPTSLEAWNADPLTLVRVVDAKGSIVGEGRETVKLQNVLPGLYRAQLLAPDGSVIEQTVSVEEGEQESVMLTPGTTDIDPARLGQLKRTFGFKFNRDDGSLQVSETLGAPSVAFPDLTSLVAMGLAAGALGEAVVRAQRLFGLGLNAAKTLAHRREQTAALQVLLADDSMIKDDFLKARVEVRTLDAPEPQVSAALTPAQRLKKVSELATPATPGMCLLDLVSRATAVTRFVLPAFSGRVTNLVLHRHPSGEVTAAMFLPRKKEGAKAAKQEVLLQRRLELAQRYYRSGLFAQVLDVLRTKASDADRDLLDARIDPVAELLNAYAHLRLAHSTSEKERAVHVREARAAVQALRRGYPSLSDIGAIEADLGELSERNTRLVSYCTAALNNGIPVIAFGALRLLAHVNRLNVKHARRELLARAVSARIPSLALTAWIVPAASTD